MSGKTGTNSPDGPPPIAKVRQLQRRLWVAAKRSPHRSFHAQWTCNHAVLRHGLG